MPKLYKRAAARRDLVEHAVYLAAEGGEELAERFTVPGTCMLHLAARSTGDRITAPGEGS